MAGFDPSLVRAYDQYVRKRRAEDAPLAFYGGWVPTDVLTCRFRETISTGEGLLIGDFSNVEVLVEFRGFPKTQSTWQSLRDVCGISGFASKCKRSAVSFLPSLDLCLLQCCREVHGDKVEGHRLQGLVAAAAS